MGGAANRAAVEVTGPGSELEQNLAGAAVAAFGDGSEFAGIKDVAPGSTVQRQRAKQRATTSSRAVRCDRRRAPSAWGIAGSRPPAAIGWQGRHGRCGASTGLPGKLAV